MVVRTAEPHYLRFGIFYHIVWNDAYSKKSPESDKVRFALIFPSFSFLEVKP